MSVDTATGIAATLARIRQITQITASPAAVTSSATASTSGTTTATPATGDFSSLLSAAAKSATPAATPAAASAPAGTSSPVTGAQLDAWMAKKNPGSPLVGLGDVFVREGEKNGIDPRALVSIARAESSLGLGSRRPRRATTPSAGVRTRPSPAGRTTSPRSPAACKAGYLDDGPGHPGADPGPLRARWASANDPTNLNSNWLRNTTALYAELGGDPNGSVALR